MSSLKALPFRKIVGTGNDFLFIDLRREPLDAYTVLSKRELVTRIAHRHFGVGSDGVVFVEEDAAKSGLKWDFFNSDGSSAAMCGNALRCMGRWGFLALGLDDFSFGTARGPVRVRKRGDVFAAELKFLRLDPLPISYVVDGEEKSAVLIDTGVSHAVVSIPSLDDAEKWSADIRALRFHEEAGSAGANVTFLQKIDDRSFRTVTFERGVEGFTLSCGTGVLAAASVALGVRHERPLQQPLGVNLATPGGELRVEFEKGLETVVLTGPANSVCAGTIDEGILR